LPFLPLPLATHILSACTLYQGLFVMKDQDDQEGPSRLSQETGAEGCAPDVSRGRRLDNL